MTEENIEDNSLREKLKLQLEVELGLALYPREAQQLIRRFDDDVIILNHYPIDSISSLTINSKSIDEYTLLKNNGIIYLNQRMQGKVFIEYTHCLPESEYSALLDLMEEYEKDTSISKKASSITEGKVSISYDNNLSTGATINKIIEDIRRRHSYSARVI